MASVRTDLRPCPFCGCKRLRVRHLSASVHVACTRCAATGPEAEVLYADKTGWDEAAAEQEAIKQWEERKEI